VGSNEKVDEKEDVEEKPPKVSPQKVKHQEIAATTKV
jgi:hypothetical protein